ncbi:type VI secretion system ImpA family N-terminal domain-containing protein [Erwinia tracheiphila]
MRVEMEQWLASITAPLPAEKICSRVADEHPDWAFIDGEIMKLGSLEHRSLDTAAIQQRILRLLAQESKDFRLMVHLLRLLQHSGEPQTW